MIHGWMNNGTHKMYLSTDKGDDNVIYWLFLNKQCYKEVPLSAQMFDPYLGM